MSPRHPLCLRRATLPLAFLACLGTALAQPPSEPLRVRRNFLGMHSLMNGGVTPFQTGQDWTKTLVGDGFVMDWVTDYAPEAPNHWLPFSDRIQELGRKSVVFNLAVGNPGDMSIMLLPEIVATLATADYAGYHTYSSPKDKRLVGPQSAWYAHRWRFYASMYRERGLPMPPVLYTEMNEWYQWKEGRTPPGVAPSQPWEIRDDFIAFERESATDPWAVGIAIFLFGSSSGQFEGRETANEPATRARSSGAATW